MAIQTMEELFMHGLKDIYYAEKKILNALPKMVDAVDSQDLREALETHRKETEGQVRRLEQVFENRNARPEGEKCPAIEGLVEEDEEIVGETGDGRVASAAVLADAQAVEHYEIARYGTLCTWAKMLGDDDSFSLLAETLEEEKNADRILNDLAKKEVNPEAVAR